MSLAPGARLGRYEILAPIGAGGMGEVYRARDERLKRDVAIKILPAQLAGDPERLQRFEQEAQAAGGLNHPNILAIYDIGSEPSPYIVSELLEGDTLRGVLAPGPLAPAHAIDMAAQIARGLAAAHEKGIIHRDLKPENLFVTSDDRVKILDFGLAKLAPGIAADAIDDSAATVAAMTQAGVVLGTVGYMSPEQVRGRPADHRADLFSFGAILHEMLTGRRAFAGTSPADTMSAILRDEPREPLAAIAGVPGALDRIVRRCLQKRPEDRFQSARELAVALDGVTREVAVPSGIGRLLARRRVWPVVAVAALAVLAVLAFIVAPGALRQWTSRGTASRVSSIAVLPLANLSNDPEQEYFSDGMTEALIADLARVGGLRVISRTSTMAYKAPKEALSLPQIAQQLHVDAVVEGSVLRSGDRVRITAQLIDGRSDRHLWANSYERNLTDVLSLQSEVARAVAQEIQVTLTPSEAATLSAARQVNPQAHEAYLRGRYFLARNTEESIGEAIVQFRRATELDRSDARPYSGLADAYTAMRSIYAPPRAVMPRAKDAAQTALRLDPGLAEAHVSMGGVLMYYDFDWPGAERELRQAIALAPNLAEAHDYLALYLAAVGRHPEARAEADRAMMLDPLSLIVLNDAGWVGYLGRQYDRAIETNLKAIALDQNFWPAHRDLGLAYEKAGRFPEAIAELQRARQLDSNSSILEMLGGVYAASGKKDEARRVLAEATKQASEHYVCPYEIATIHASLGDKESTLKWLQKGVDEHADCMPWARSDPKLDMLRGDPRFQAVMREMGLPENR